MRFTTKAAGFAAALVASASMAGAQVTVTGSTFGCFGAGCTNYTSSATYAIGTTGASIQFTGVNSANSAQQTFTGTTNPVTNAFSVGNFGSLVVNGLTGTTPNTTFNTPFTLEFVLSAPAGSSTPTTTFLVSGFVGSVNGMASRDIAYTGGTTSFTFPNGSGTITVNPDNIGTAANNIGGRVMATAVATVPEPSTYALMAMGLVGTLAAARRRRSA